MINYKIDVCTVPNYQDNEYKPYWWMLAEFHDGGTDWCNSGFGWAKTPELAWKEAYDFYNKYKKDVL